MLLALWMLGSMSLKAQVTYGYATFPYAVTNIAGANFLLGQKINVPVATLISHIGLNAGDAENINLSIYSDNANAPGALLAQTGVLPFVAGQNLLPLTASINLPPGDYWVMETGGPTNFQFGAENTNANGSTLTYYQVHTYTDPLPANFGSGLTYIGGRASMYLYGTLSLPIWTGNVSTDWAVPGNWQNGTVPTATDDVTIPDVTNDPVIMGGTAALANSVWVQTSAVLTINATGILTINGSRSFGAFTAGFYNGGTVSNTGNLILGSTGSVGDYGIYNQATFNNNIGGEISIDWSNDTGLNNDFGTFTNAAKITIGANASVGSVGIRNLATFNNSTCTAIIRIASNAIVNNTGTSTNAGLIIENASGNSSITTNAGIVQNLNGGTFTVGSGNPAITSTATITDACCPNPPIAAITITENNVSASPFTGLAYHNISYTDGILCTGPNYPNPTTSATLTASGGGTYLWSTNATSAAITTSIAGTYTVTVTSPIGCTSTASQTIAVNPAPNAGTITATPNLPGINGGKGVCFGSTITLSSTVPGGEWSMFTGFQVVSVNSVTGLVTPIVNTNSTDTSSVRYQVSALGCVSGVLTQVEVLNSPNAGTISGNTTLCFNTFGVATTQLSTNGASGGTWASSNPSISVNSSGLVSTNGPGTTTISYTVTSGSCTSSTSTQVTWNALPNTLMTTPGFGEICQGASFSISVPDAGTGTSYNWSGDGVVNANSNSTTAHPTSAGYKTYTVTITPSNGCGAIGYGSVDVGALPDVTITATPNPLCFGVPLSLSIPQAASTTVSWSGPGINSTTGFSTTASPTTTGLKTYTVTATTDAFLGSCVATGIVDVNVIDCCPAPGAIWYVNAAAAPGGNGASWECAFQDLQLALAAASSGHQIWVAQGTYKPTSGTNRSISFNMKEGVEILGGFPNTGDPGLGNRDWATNVTVLSGEIGAAGLTDNSEAIIVNTNISSIAVLDGFRIAFGYSVSPGPQIFNTGPGLFNIGNSSPTIRNCTFMSNTGDFGGTVLNINNCFPTFTNCVFLGNRANYWGAACLSYETSVATFINCSFSGNTGNPGVIYSNGLPAVLKNCIIWGNGTQSIAGQATITNSIIEGGHAGTGNLNVDPKFVSQPPVGLGTAGDLHLQICSPAIDAANDTDAPANDLDGNARFDALTGGNVADMGAFEFQSAATPTVAICQSSVNAVLDNTGHATVLATALNNSSTGCSPLVFSISGQSSITFDCSQIGNQTTTLTATYVNRTSTCITTVNVMDNTPPTITCPANIAKTTDAGQCSALTTYSVTASDNCAYTLTRTSPAGTASGSSFPLGMTNVAWSVTDAGGNATSCAFTVTVTDNAPPTITCPANIAKTTDPGQCSAVTIYSVTAADNCSSQFTLTRTNGLPSGAAFPTGPNVVNWLVTDAGGSSTICSFTVTVTDGQLPSIVCPGNISKTTDPGQCSAVTTYATPTFSDNCAGVYLTRTSGQASGTAFPTGTHTVNWRATDLAGNSSVCNFIVTVADGQAPSITCPANLVKNTDAGQCSTVVTYAMPTFSDNCAGATAALFSGQVSGTVFTKGTTSVIWQATDAVNLTKRCTFTVTVNDAQVPTIACPSNQVKAADAGICTAVVNYTLPTFTDNCAGGSVEIQSGMVSGSAFPKGQTTVVWKATDAVGLTKTCSFKVTVNDTQAPVFTLCPSSQSVSTDAGLCTAAVTYTTPTASDNCTPPPTVVKQSGLASGSAFPKGTSTVVWRATDGAGLTKTCSFTVTVTDVQLPTITCPSNIAVPGSGSSCSAVVTYANPTASDNCGIASNILLSGLASGAQFSQGVTTNIWRATDNSGLTRTCAFTVTVGCGTAPSSAKASAGKSEQVAVSREELAVLTTGNQQLLTMNLAPNPATTQVQVIVEGLGENGGELTVFDAQGRMVWQQANVQNPRYSIDVSTLPSGLYQVRLSTERGVVTKGLVVSRL